MLEFCLLPLTWNLDPVTLDRLTGSGARSITTCSQPAARVVTLAAVHASLPTRVSDSFEIAWWLKRWEQSTSEQPVWSRSRREELQRAIQRKFNEHTAAATDLFVGSVNADRLTECYDWTIVERTRERIVFDAIPRDETDRLFHRSFRVCLDVDGSPEQIIAIGRNQHQQTVWKSDTTTTIDGIQLVRFEDGVIPPTPKPRFRTADARLD